MGYIDMQLVKGPELKGHIGVLNDSALLPEPIVVAKGARIATLAAAFVKGIEAINAVGKLDEVNEVVFNYYSTIMQEGDPPKPDADARTPSAAATDEATEGADAEAKKTEATAAAAQEAALSTDPAAEKKAAAAAKKEEKKQAAADKKKAAADAKKAAADDKKAKAAEAKKAKAATATKAPPKKAPPKKAPAKKAEPKKAPAKKAPAKPKAKAKPVLVKSAIFGKVLLSKKTKKWDVKALVEAVAEKTGSPHVDTRRKCNTYIALLRTMGVLEDAGDKLVMAEWYRKALSEK